MAVGICVFSGECLGVFDYCLECLVCFELRVTSLVLVCFVVSVV